jgi:hypothetical protein
MTKVAFSLLALACLQHSSDTDTGKQNMNIQSIELYANDGALLETGHSRTYRSDKGSNSDIIRIHAGTAVRFVPQKKPLFGYYANGEGEATFVDYRVATEKNDPQEAQLQHITIPAHGCVRAHASNDYLRWFVRSLRGKSYDTLASGSGCAQHCHCAVYAGAVDRTPIPSTDWFPTTVDADNVRNTALSMCGISGTTDAALQAPAHEEDEKTLHLVLYQRDQNRRFTSLHKIVKELRARNTSAHKQHARWRVTVLKHSEQTSPCALIKALHQADILLTAHGFQSTGIRNSNQSTCAVLFMPLCAIVPSM